MGEVGVHHVQGALGLPSHKAVEVQFELRIDVITVHAECCQHCKQKLCKPKAERMQN